MKSALKIISTEQSMHEGTGTVEEYVNKAKEMGITRLLLADKCALNDFVTFYKACKAAEIDPMLGLRLTVRSKYDFISFLNKNKSSSDNINGFLSTLSEGGNISGETLISLEYEDIESFSSVFDSIVTLKESIRKKSAKSTMSKSEKSVVSSVNSLLEDLRNKGLSVRDNFTIDDIVAISSTVSESIVKDFKSFDRSSDHANILLVANDNDGYLNLKKLVSKSFIEGQYFVKEGKKRNKKEFPVLKLSALKNYTKGLSVLLGDPSDILEKALRSGKRYKSDSDEIINQMKDLFGEDNVLSQISKKTKNEKDSFIKSEAALHDRLLDVSITNNIPVIATNNVIFPDEDMLITHELKKAIILQENVFDINYVKTQFGGQYMKSPEEDAEDFISAPILLDNAAASFANQALKPELDIAVLPDFTVPEGYTQETYFNKISKEGTANRLAIKFETESTSTQDQITITKKYMDRLEFELKIINDMGFAGYFLIVQDFIRWAKEAGVAVGPGRGSGAGSLVAYGLLITDVDPIEFDLLFERFLNPERVSMPDFDIDFAFGYHPITGKIMGRDDVINYVAKKYNSPKNEFPSVGQISTKGTMKAKSVLKDTAKALGCTIPYYEKLSKLVPEGIDVDLKTTFAESEDFVARYESEPKTRALIDECLKLEKRKKSTGSHAGGVVIARGELTDFAPIEWDKEHNRYITQYDMKSVEKAGLVKFDFLGLANLATIALCQKIIKDEKNITIDFQKIPKTDRKTYELLQAGATHSVFQLESPGMRGLASKLKIDNFEEISALLALYRPGPLESGMVDDFIERKHGIQEVAYPHPLTEDILKNTYGVILYQEQVMQIAQVMGGYSLGQADILRRAMGKKDKEEMKSQESVFVEGCKENDVDEETAVFIFDLIEKFSGYGFNKSHSVAYAFVSYQTAYLKANYPNEYMTSVLTSKQDDIEKLESVIKEVRSMGISVIKPNINESNIGFKANYKNEQSILFGLSSVKGTGSSAEFFIAERDKNGPFKDIKDVMLRVGKKHANKGSMEALIYAGAFDFLPSSDKMYEVEKVQHHINKDGDITHDESLSVKKSNFYEADGKSVELSPQLKRSLLMEEFNTFKDVMPTQAQMKKIVSEKGHPDFIKDAIPKYKSVIADSKKQLSEREFLFKEKAVMGCYLTSHPLDIGKIRDRLGQSGALHTSEIIKNLCLQTEDDDSDYPETHDVRTAGVIVEIRESKIKKESSKDFGKKIINMTIEDGHGETAVTIFPTEHEYVKDFIEIGNVIAIKGQAKSDEYAREGFKIACSDFISLIPYQEFKIPQKKKFKNKSKP